MADASETPAQRIDLDRFTPVEGLLYRASPLGFIGTTLAIFLISAGSLVLIAWLTGYSHLVYFDPAAGWRVDALGRIGIVLSMILTAGVALTEGGRRRLQSDRDNLVATLTPDGHEAANAVCNGLPVSWRWRYMLVTGLGIAGGLGSNLMEVLGGSRSPLDYLGSVGLWSLLFSPLLYASGARAALSVVRGGQEIRQLISAYVEVDLFHLERLDVFGRIGLRAAASWLVMAGVILLLIADPRQIAIALPLIGLAILGGALGLANAVRPIQHRIREAKSQELDEIHARMAQAHSRALGGDAAAAALLAGLTGYETWIEKRSEWPISASVTRRFSLYILIPVLPILGSYLFEKMADGLIYGGLF